MDKIFKKHFKCIEQIDNPHIFASKSALKLDLIKKFLGNLLTPLIPYEMFH